MSEARKVVCGICPHACQLEEGRTGLCRARRNVDGRVVAINYGKVTSLALDPVEKKPLSRFYPGSYILSVGSFGCNLRCPFCQNHGISMADEQSSDAAYASPEDLADKALQLEPQGNIGLAYTYNEPLVGYEYVKDCAALVRKRGLKNVLVSNGYVNKEPLAELLPLLDAVNIDLKGFTEEFYRNVKGGLETVKETIRAANATDGCHVEVTTLVIPGENDGEEEMRALSEWLASVNPNIPLHLTRFYPRYRYKEAEPTPLPTLERLAKVAGQNLHYIF